jgi:hypothetical protein
VTEGDKLEADILAAWAGMLQEISTRRFDIPPANEYL